MKRKLFISAIVLLIATALTYAREQERVQTQQNPPGRGVWVDEDNNGICDNFEARAAAGFRNGIRPFMRGGRQDFETGEANRGILPGRGYCRNYTGSVNSRDAGNYSNAGNRAYGRNYISAGNRGYGRNYINAGNRGYGRNYIDANNNGICDYREIP
ncbi:MAG TPA: hypothetical protein PLZ75_05550 [Bacteroidales bacterium]|jgi:hypothetical protein|nr:hypothetical protein [Bacteroidales bacterium]HQH23213.1 hypothetical protein [Bacteroidales bacterium]HQJ80929.1 hypothetical protein [Bacteroidales bacterium]